MSPLTLTVAQTQHRKKFSHVSTHVFCFLTQVSEFSLDSVADSLLCHLHSF